MLLMLTTACVVPVCMSQQLTTPRRLNVSLVLLSLVFSTKQVRFNKLTIVCKFVCVITQYNIITDTREAGTQ